MEGKLLLIITVILAISNLYSNLKEARKNNKFNKWNIIDIIYFGFLIVVLVINNEELIYKFNFIGVIYILAFSISNLKRIQTKKK